MMPNRDDTGRSPYDAPDGCSKITLKPVIALITCVIMIKKMRRKTGDAV